VIVDGFLFKYGSNFHGRLRDWYEKREYKVVCKPYSDKKYNVFIEKDSKLKLIGTMIKIDPVEVRGNKKYKQVAVIKLFDDDYDYFVLEDKSKNGKTYYKII